MGIFADYAPKYFELGYNVIPVEKNSKRCLVPNWNRFCSEIMTEEELNELCEKYPDHNIGLPLGPANDLICFDFDYNGENADYFESLVRNILPQSPIERFGSKGFGLFFKHKKLTGKKKVSRGNELFFEILSDGRYTVIPPSIHPSGCEYKWKTRFSFSNLKDGEVSLPSLEEFHIKRCDYIAKTNLSEIDKKDGRLSGRHLELFSYFISIVDTCSSFDELVENIFNKDKTLNGEKSYWHDKREWGDRPAFTACKSEVKRWVNWLKNKKSSEGINWDVGQKVGKTTTADSFDIFFNSHLPEIKKDLITDDYFHTSRGRVIETLGTMSVHILKARCHDEGRPASKMENYLYDFLDKIEPKLMIDIPKWEGIDQIGMLKDYISFNEFSKDHFIDLIKEWFSLCIKRIYNPKIQNRVLLLKGNQGIGKDTLFDHLFSSFGNYYSQMMVKHDEKSNFESMKRLIVANISEFDKTSKMEVSMLKNIITASEAVFREAYARKATTHQFRTSFISSCNMDDILRDFTGNRRYMIFDVKHIDWDFTKKINPDQVLAQAFNLAETNYTASQDARLAMDMVIEKYTPDDPYIEAGNCFDEFVRRLVLKDASTVVRAADIEPILKTIVDVYGISRRNVQSLLKRTGRSQKVNGNVIYKARERTENLGQIQDELLIKKLGKKAPILDLTQKIKELNGAATKK